VDGRRLGLAVGAALAAAILVRWPVAVVGAAAVGWLVPLPGQRSSRREAEARSEAIAQWCEMLRDAAGTSRGIEGILVATAASPPGPIRAEIRRLADRLEDEPLDQALDGLVNDLDHPIGDLVSTALRVAATSGSRRVAAVLGNLATAAHHEASMRRRVEVARARPRAAMRLVAGIVGLFVGGLVLFAREYLAPYSTVTGQLVLLGIGFYWTLGLLWMARLGRLPEIGRFLAKPRAVPATEAGR
jgi:tight adherence protein B